MMKTYKSVKEIVTVSNEDSIISSTEDNANSKYVYKEFTL